MYIASWTVKVLLRCSHTVKRWSVVIVEMRVDLDIGIDFVSTDTPLSDSVVDNWRLIFRGAISLD